MEIWSVRIDERPKQLENKTRVKRAVGSATYAHVARELIGKICNSVLQRPCFLVHAVNLVQNNQVYGIDWHGFFIYAFYWHL